MKLNKHEFDDCIVYSEVKYVPWRNESIAKFKFQGGAEYIIQKEPPWLSYPDDLFNGREFADLNDLVSSVEAMIALGDL
jgi:hypothetical protein